MLPTSTLKVHNTPPPNGRALRGLATLVVLNDEIKRSCDHSMSWRTRLHPPDPKQLSQPMHARRRRRAAREPKPLSAMVQSLAHDCLPACVRARACVGVSV